MAYRSSYEVESGNETDDSIQENSSSEGVECYLIDESCSSFPDINEINLTGSSEENIVNTETTEPMVPPVVPDINLPKIGNTYHSLDEAIGIYRKYAKLAGFTSKLGTESQYADKTNGKVLNALFWADELAKENYALFSDVISVDATYRTNRYKMVFVPFTAINNHDKTINVGAALLSDETIESYSWLLETFLEAHGHPPTLILSDQDPALNQAISKILPNTTHRLCMWHIMAKMPKKIAKDIVDNSSFKKKNINKLVWNIHLDIAEFEERWERMISEFNLRENKWLHDIYMIRAKWIPAYFRHIPMCGMMKTTSRLESSNSFFNVFSNHNNLLVNFMFNFDIAVTKQRHDQQQLDIESISPSSTALVSDKFNEHIEKHAATIYTRAIFLMIQKELRKALSLCYQRSEVEFEDYHVHTIVYKNHKTRLRSEYQVTVNYNVISAECTCQKFNHFGILCCQTLRVFLDNDINQIPEQYVLPRWRKNVIIVSNSKNKIKWGVFNSETSQLVDQASAQFDRCMDKVVHDKDKILALIEKLKGIELDSGEESSNERLFSRNKDFVEDIVGLQIGKSIEIDVPGGITNKGGNRKTRLVSSKEKALAKAKHPTRECKGCHLYVHHDRRNCPVNPSKKLKPHKKISKR